MNGKERLGEWETGQICEWETLRLGDFEKQRSGETVISES